jgi:hypothetical protein
MLKKSASGDGRLRMRLSKIESTRRLTLTSTSAYFTHYGLTWDKACPWVKRLPWQIQGGWVK